MKQKVFIVSMLAVSFSFACARLKDFPTEFPTPEPLPAATPVAKVEYKRDANLEAEIAKIAAAAKGKVGVAAVVLESGKAAFVGADERYPMQSVYKLPISMAVIDQVRLGKLDLDEKIGVTKDDMVRIGQRSPLRDKDPNGGEFTIRELISLALVESDGTASDVLMRVADGPSEIQGFLTQIGVADMKVVNTEKELGRDWLTQYDNWATPMAAIDLLRWLNAGRNCNCATVPEPDVDEKGVPLLFKLMISSKPGEKRIKGALLKDTIVAHKTGTSGTQNGITAATNDIGIIDLPAKKHLAIAVFVSDSPADEKTREAVIAKIARTVWDKWQY